MTVQNILAALRALDASITIEGNQLVVDASKGAITDDLRQQIREHKLELLQQLQPQGEETESTAPTIADFVASCCTLASHANVRGATLIIALARWRRQRLMPFTVTIPKAKQDKTLATMLRQELPGIFTWAVQGCLAWQQDGLGEPDEVGQATENYRVGMDIVGVFLDEMCFLGDNYRVKASDLWNAYKAWCESNGEHAGRQRDLGTRLTECGLMSRPGTQGIPWWVEVTLRASEVR